MHELGRELHAEEAHGDHISKLIDEAHKHVRTTIDTVILLRVF